MSAIVASPPTRTSAIRDRDLDRADLDRRRGLSRLSVLLEALAYAGASIDPTAALAAQRFARVRDRRRG